MIMYSPGIVKDASQKDVATPVTLIATKGQRVY
jgi:hypothetical protein